MDDHVVRGTGHRLRPTGFVPMPDKVRGKHRWIVIATHTVTARALAETRRGGEVHLDMENLLGVYTGCVDCEQIYPAPEPCPAGDEWGTS